MAVGLVLLGLSAASPGAAAGAATLAREEVRTGYSVYQKAMKDFLEGEYCADSTRRRWNFWRRQDCRDWWTAARSGIERVLADYPDSLEPGEKVPVKGRWTEYYRPHYYLGICLCELGDRDTANQSFLSVMDWYKDYPALQWYVDRCVLPSCGEDQKSLPKGCDRPRTVAAAETPASRTVAASPSSGAALCSPASLRAAPW